MTASAEDKGTRLRNWWHWATGIRARVIASGVLIMMPFVVLTLGQAHREARETFDEATTRARYLALDAADRNADPFQRTEALLDMVAHSGRLMPDQPASCSAFLNLLHARYTWTFSLSVADAAGNIQCSTLPASLTAAADRQALLAAARARGRYVLGGYETSPAGHVPVVAAAMPVLDKGKVAWIADATIDLAAFNQWLVSVASKPDVSLTVIDAHGTVIGQTPQPRPVVGNSIAASQLGRAMLAERTGTIETTDPFGAKRIFAFAPVAGTSAILAVGIDRQPLLQRIQHRLLRDVTLLCLIVLLSMTLGLLGTEAMLFAPMDRLNRLLGAIGAGDYRAARRIPRLPPEFAPSAQALSSMAAEIERRETELNDSEARYHLIEENISDVIMLLDTDLNRTFVSSNVARLFGWSAETMVGLSQLTQVHPDDQQTVLEAEKSLLAGKDQETIVYRARGRNDGWFWVESIARRVTDPKTGAPAGIVFVARDISKRKAIEDQLAAANKRLQAFATMDGLTELANRRRFDEGMSTEWRRAERRLEPLSLLFIDVDHFKAYNDLYGHQAGDTCLKQVARALQSAVRRPGDLTARYGGEEFAVILPHTDEEGAQLIAEKIRLAVQAAAISHTGNPPYGVVTISIGVATIVPRADLAAETLIARADRALYAAKRGGRNRICLARQDDSSLLQIPV